MPSPRRWIAAGCLLGLGLLVTDLALGGPLSEADGALHRWLSGHPHPVLTVISAVLAQAGNEFLLIPALGLLCLATAWRIRSVRPLLAVFAVCVTLAGVVPAVKIATGRTAPRSGVDLWFAGGTEFPSGHAVNAIVLVALFLELLVVGFPGAARWLPPRRRRCAVAALGIAGGVGMVGLAYHWLTDAVGGWLIGVLLYLAVQALIRRMFRAPTDAGRRPAEQERGTPAPSAR